VTVITRPERGTVVQQLHACGENAMHRGKTVRFLDLKAEGSFDEPLALIAVSDVLIEANRPGIMERLGLGPAGVRGPQSSSG
jgi:alpha-methylacyl-CoA racemase